MTLQKIVEMLKTAPASSIDPEIKEKINEVNIEDEGKVRELFQFLYECGFHGSVSPFVATLVNPEYTVKYPLK